MGAHPLALLGAPLPRRDLRRLAGTRLGAREDRIELHAEACERDANGAGLALAARGQFALLICARTVGLGLGMT